MSYSFLLEMAWKSAAISGAALLLVALLRSRSAADRGALLRVGIVMLLLLPAVSLLMPALEIETAAPAANAGPALAAMAYDVPAAAAPLAEPSALAASTGGDWNDP